MQDVTGLTFAKTPFSAEMTPDPPSSSISSSTSSSLSSALTAARFTPPLRRATCTISKVCTTRGADTKCPRAHSYLPSNQNTFSGEKIHRTLYLVHTRNVTRGVSSRTNNSRQGTEFFRPTVFAYTAYAVRLKNETHVRHWRGIATCRVTYCSNATFNAQSCYGITTDIL